MDTYKGRRVLNAATASVARIERKTFTDIPFHEVCANARAERAVAEKQDAALVAAYLESGKPITYANASAKVVRKEQVYGVRLVNSITGKREYVARVIPAIHVPVIPRKGGAISYCAPRSRG